MTEQLCEAKYFKNILCSNTDKIRSETNISNIVTILSFFQLFNFFLLLLIILLFCGDKC